LWAHNDVCIFHIIHMILPNWNFCYPYQTKVLFSGWIVSFWSTKNHGDKRIWSNLWNYILLNIDKRRRHPFASNYMRHVMGHYVRALTEEEILERYEHKRIAQKWNVFSWNSGISDGWVWGKHLMINANWKLAWMASLVSA